MRINPLKVYDKMPVDKLPDYFERDGNKHYLLARTDRSVFYAVITDGELKSYDVFVIKINPTRLALVDMGILSKQEIDSEFLKKVMGEVMYEERYPGVMEFIEAQYAWSFDSQSFDKAEEKFYSL